MTLNLRAIRARERDLARAIGAEIRALRENAGLLQARVARAAGVTPGHLCRIEAGTARPTTDVLLRLGAVLGADLSIRYFPTTGPRLRDHTQLPMGECLLECTMTRWRRVPEVAVYRPVRGIIDIVLDDRHGIDTVASEIQGQLRRVEQQVRWAGQKADALAALPDQAGRRVSKLLVPRNTHALREIARAAHATLEAAYPARTKDAVAALRGEAAWPGSAVVWMRVERGLVTMVDGPPRGVALGR